MALLRIHWELVSVHSWDKAMLLICCSTFELFENLFLSLDSHYNLTVDVLYVHIFSASVNCGVSSHERGFVSSWRHLSQHSWVSSGGMASESICMRCSLLNRVNWILLTWSSLRVSGMLLVVWSGLRLRVPLWRLLIHGLVFSALLLERTDGSELFSIGQFWWPLSHL
jgi:hypothetical protein